MPFVDTMIFVSYTKVKIKDESRLSFRSANQKAWNGKSANPVLVASEVMKACL